MRSLPLRMMMNGSNHHPSSSFSSLNEKSKQNSTNCAASDLSSSELLSSSSLDARRRSFGKQGSLRSLISRASSLLSSPNHDDEDYDTDDSHSETTIPLDEDDEYEEAEEEAHAQEDVIAGADDNDDCKPQPGRQKLKKEKEANQQTQEGEPVRSLLSGASNSFRSLLSNHTNSNNACHNKDKNASYEEEEPQLLQQREEEEEEEAWNNDLIPRSILVQELGMLPRDKDDEDNAAQTNCYPPTASSSFSCVSSLSSAFSGVSPPHSPPPRRTLLRPSDRWNATTATKATTIEPHSNGLDAGVDRWTSGGSTHDSAMGLKLSSHHSSTSLTEQQQQEELDTTALEADLLEKMERRLTFGKHSDSSCSDDDDVKSLFSDGSSASSFGSAADESGCFAAAENGNDNDHSAPQNAAPQPEDHETNNRLSEKNENLANNETDEDIIHLPPLKGPSNNSAHRRFENDEELQDRWIEQTLQKSRRHCDAAAFQTNDDDDIDSHCSSSSPQQPSSLLRLSREDFFELMERRDSVHACLFLLMDSSSLS